MSKFKYHMMGLIVFMTVLISASLSAQYGIMSAGEDASVYEKAIMAATFCIFDLIVVLIASEASNRFLTKTAAKILFIVLMTLSCLSGAAYMIGQQSAGQGTEIAMLKRQINSLDDNISRLDPVTRPGNLRELRTQRERAYSELSRAIAAQGGEVTKSNAIFIYLANLFGLSANSIATIVKLITMFSLNMSGVILAAIRHQARPQVQSDTALSPRPMPVAQAADADILKHVKQAVMSGRVKPSVTAVAQNFCKNNRAMADHYLSLLEEAGIVKSQGHGKKRLLTV